MQEGGVGGEFQFLELTVDVIDGAIVTNDRAFGSAGGARGVEHVRRVCRIAVDSRIRLGRGRPRGSGVVEEQEVTQITRGFRGSATSDDGLAR